MATQLPINTSSAVITEQNNNINNAGIHSFLASLIIFFNIFSQLKKVKMDKKKLLDSLMSSFEKAHPNKKKCDSQKEVHKIWNDIKGEKDLDTRVKILIQQYDSKATKQKGSMMSYWASTPKQAIPVNPRLEFEPNSSQFTEEIVDDDNAPAGTSKEKPSEEKKKSRTYAQDRINSDIDVLNKEIVALTSKKRGISWTDDDEKVLKKKRSELEQLEKDLNKRVSNQKSKNKSREKKKVLLEKVCTEHPEIKNALKIRERTGRPALEVEQPLLLKTIIDIAVHGSAAHEKRQSDVYRVNLFIIMLLHIKLIF